jgi:hypothetical protein
MTGMDDQPAGRQWAEPGRESDAQQLFPYRTMSPEEYAARHGVDWGSFSFDVYRYRDEALDVWIAALGRIFSTPGRVAECQVAWLTEAELARVRARAEEEF